MQYTENGTFLRLRPFRLETMLKAKQQILSLRQQGFHRIMKLTDKREFNGQLWCTFCFSFPALRTVMLVFGRKNASFVYQDKRGFFLLSGVKQPETLEKTA